MSNALSALREEIEAAWCVAFAETAPRFSILPQAEGFPGDYRCDILLRGRGAAGNDPRAAEFLSRLETASAAVELVPGGMLALTVADPVSLLDSTVGFRRSDLRGVGIEPFSAWCIPPRSVLSPELRGLGYLRILGSALASQAIAVVAGRGGTVYSGSSILLRAEDSWSVRDWLSAAEPVMRAALLETGTQDEVGPFADSVQAHFDAHRAGRVLVFTAHGVIDRDRYRRLAKGSTASGVDESLRHRLVSFPRDWLLADEEHVPDPLPPARLIDRPSRLAALIVLLAGGRSPRDLDLSAAAFEERANLPWFISSVTARIATGAGFTVPAPGSPSGPRSREACVLVGGAVECFRAALLDGRASDLIALLESLTHLIARAIDAPRRGASTSISEESSHKVGESCVEGKIVSSGFTLLSDIIALCDPEAGNFPASVDIHGIPHRP